MFVLFTPRAILKTLIVRIHLPACERIQLVQYKYVLILASLPHTYPASFYSKNEIPWYLCSAPPCLRSFENELSIFLDV
jgi:hypothetical protein